MKRLRWGLLLFGVARGTSLAAQAGGAIAGHVRQAGTGQPIAGALVTVVESRQGAVTDTSGAYRVREVRSGWYRLRVTMLGYRPAVRDSVPVRSGGTVIVDFGLTPAAEELAPVTVEARADEVLDPLATATTQRMTGEEIRRLPVTTLREAVALSAGSVGESYRGGRVGEEAFILDGLGIKNQLDASTGPQGFRIPPDLLTEAALVTNGFSARYGQAISGLINVVTKDGGERRHARLAYEGDRPLWASWDLGVDRAVASSDGRLVGRVGYVAVLDAEGRLDADPVNAPAPVDPRDLRSRRPTLLPHNSGERLDAAGKLTIPMGARHTMRLFGLRSVQQRLLFDPAFKYDDPFGPAQRVRGDLVSAHVERTADPRALHPVTMDLRVGYFAREFLRGVLDRPVSYRYGAFTGRTFRFMGEDLARARDTAAARAAIPGFARPDYSEATPWGVPAFFLGVGSNGDIAWNRFRELRGQLNASIGVGPYADLYVGGEVSRQRVETFQRVLGYLPVDTGVPPPASSEFSPRSGAGYAELQLLSSEFAFTAGLRYDRFDARADLGPGRARGGVQHSLSPRFAFSAILDQTTFVVSWGRFSQAPDYQYLVDAAFDDTTRTGRFRRGNPDLGFEQATQVEFSVRTRPAPRTSLRLNGFTKRLNGLVASVPLGVNPDSTIFGSTDFGIVKGAEAIVEREFHRGMRVRAAYTIQSAQATATNGFQLPIRVGPAVPGDTLPPDRIEFPLDYDRRHSLTVIAQARVSDSVGPLIRGARVLAGLEAAAIVRWGSGLPYSRTNATGDSLIALPNSSRLPSQATVDLLVRRPLVIWGVSGGLYVDVRNLLNRRNVVAVRRELGQPGLDETGILALAQAAYATHPEAIPYESPRYRPEADLNRNGLIEGQAELLPLYVAAARDFTQPLFAFGPPRVVRIGVEIVF